MDDIEVFLARLSRETEELVRKRQRLVDEELRTLRDTIFRSQKGGREHTAFGSFATGTALVNSDLDISVRASQGDHPRNLLETKIQKLPSYKNPFREVELVEGMIKGVTKQGLRVDITYNNSQGIQEVETVQKYMRSFPIFGSVIRIIKTCAWIYLERFPTKGRAVMPGGFFYTKVVGLALELWEEVPGWRKQEIKPLSPGPIGFERTRLTDLVIKVARFLGEPKNYQSPHYVDTKSKEVLAKLFRAVAVCLERGDVPEGLRTIDSPDFKMDHSQAYEKLTNLPWVLQQESERRTRIEQEEIEENKKRQEEMDRRIELQKRLYENFQYSSDFEDDRDEFRDYGWTNDESDLDFTACSVEDCGYCGHCMY